MEAFFADIKQWGYYADASYAPNPELKGFGNDHPFPPEIEVENPYLKQRIAKLQKRIGEIVADADKKLKSEAKQKKDFEIWRQASRKFLKQWPGGWAAPKPEVALKFKDTNIVAQTNFTLQSDATVSFSDNVKENTKFTLPVSNGWIAAIRLEIVPQEIKEAKKMAQKKRNGSAITISASLKTKEGKETKVPFYFGDADTKAERYLNGSMGLPVLGVTDLWQISPEHDLQTAVWLLDKPVKVSDGELLIVNLGNAAVASARVSVTPFAAEEPLKSGAKNFKEKPRQTYLFSTHWNPEAIGEARKILPQIRECRNGCWPTMVTEQRAEPPLTRVLARGNWQDDSGEIVQPLPPHFLPQPKVDGTNRLTRLDLARWIVSRDNPLTARAVVNRYWKEFFGRGLSIVVDDLGGQGEPPSHPELLDWLAVEFMDSNWNVKHMVKLMVMSSTYRQSSNLRLELKDIDPNNRLLASQNPRRLEAEFVRDSALCIAGLLNEDIGGPSARPYQPPGYYANLQFPDRDYFPDKDERQYRRGVYTHWQRTFLQPMLANFDAPQREECVCARNISNTPQQALALLNDPTLMEASRVFAAEVLADGKKSDEQKLDSAFEKALARDVKPKEKDSLLKFLDLQREYYRSNNEDSKKLLAIGIAPAPKNFQPAELAAWTQVCRVVLNLHETITRY